MSFSREELDQAIADAEGRAAAEAEARTRAELEADDRRRLVRAHEAIASALTEHQERYDQLLATRTRTVLEVAVALARTVVPRALEARPLADIASMVERLVGRLDGQPSLELRLAPSALEQDDGALEMVARNAGYRGHLEVVPDPALHPGDAKLAWRHGHAERDLRRLEAEAAGIAEAWLGEAQAEPGGEAGEATAGGAGVRTVEREEQR